MSETTGTFLVTEADAESAVLRDVETGQVYTLAANDRDLERDAVVDATLAPIPPMDVAYELASVDGVREIDVLDSDLSPTTQAMEIADDLAVGDVERVERAGTGEIHVLRVPPAETASAAADVRDDAETIARAARLDAVRVEVRTDTDAGVLNVRYLPD
jgi:hypothetical protein